MGKTLSLSPLRTIKTTKDRERFVGFNEGEDQEQPLSPMSRLFHQPGFDVYIIAVIGLKSLINLDVFKTNVVTMIDINHRFSSLQVLDKENGNMSWVPTHINIENHIIVPEIDLNMESPDKFVEEYISNLSRSRIENSKPLWDIHILNIGTSDAQATCLFRIHHSLGDGLSLMNFLLSGARKASNHKELPTLSVDKRSHQHTRVTSLRSGYMVLWNTFVALVMFILTTLFLKDTKTPLKSSTCAADRPRRFVITSFSLADIKMVKNAMGVTVNDVLVGVVQAGLCRYLLRRYGGNSDSVPENIRLCATLAFNLRTSMMVDANDTTKYGTWGNKISYVLLPFNIKHRKNPLDHVWDANVVMERKKASLEPYVTSFVASLVLKLFGDKIAGKIYQRVYSNTTLIFSNVPGPKEEIWSFGHEVAYIAATDYGTPAALMIQVMSYADKVTLTVSADEETIPDARKLSDDFQHSLNLIISSVLAAKK